MLSFLYPADSLAANCKERRFRVKSERLSSLRNNPSLTFSTNWSLTIPSGLWIPFGLLHLMASMLVKRACENSRTDSPSSCFLWKNCFCKVMKDLVHPKISINISKILSGLLLSVDGRNLISFFASPSRWSSINNYCSPRDMCRPPTALRASSTHSLTGMGSVACPENLGHFLSRGK